MSSFDSSSALTMRTQQKRVEPTSRLLEADDVAEYLGVRTDWVYREVRAGRLPHIRLGRAVRFRRESIEAWIDSRERGVPARRRL
jgi:excisionase family DNA binding protein